MGMKTDGDAREVAGAMDPFPELSLLEQRMDAKMDKVIEALGKISGQVAK
jgi:hypothetical protein